MSDTGTKFAPWMLGVVGVVFAGGIGVGTGILFKLNASVEVLSSKVESLDRTIADKTSDRYTATEAMKDRGVLSDLILSHEGRMKRLEDKVEKLELEAAERRGRSITQHGE